MKVYRLCMPGQGWTDHMFQWEDQQNLMFHFYTQTYHFIRSAHIMHESRPFFNSQHVIYLQKCIIVLQVAGFIVYMTSLAVYLISWQTAGSKLLIDENHHHNKLVHHVHSIGMADTPTESQRTWEHLHVEDRFVGKQYHNYDIFHICQSW